MASDIQMTDASPPPTDPISSSSAHPPSFDLGNLMLSSSAPIPPNPSNAHLNSLAASHAQSLISQLLTTRPIFISPSDRSTVLLSLPPTTTPLPREKPLPKPRQKTKWEAFAEKKGIGKNKRKDTADGKVYDEATGDWVPKHGYKGANKGGEDDWIVEVNDEQKEKKMQDEGKTIRGEGRRERKEKVKRQERKERANQRKGGKSRDD